MSIGSRITTLRKGLNLSQEDIADKIGVSRQSVSKWETDTSAPDAFNLIALAEVLKTNVEYIVTGKVEENIKPTQDKTSNCRFTSLSILGFILAIGGILIGIIGMFLHEIWCIIGAFLVATGFIFALCKGKKSFIISFSILSVLIVITVLLLTL